MSHARREGYWGGVGDADRQVDSGGSRPSKNNCQGPSEGGELPDFEIDADDLPNETGLRPISVEPGRKLRKEAVFEQTEEFRSRPWYAVVNAWRRWYRGYENSHLEFEGPDGETGRTKLENSYMPSYGKRYYAKLKDLERGIERQYEDLTTAMLTFSASNLNAYGQPRAPGDHMREIADGWDVARKHLYQALDGLRWEYAKVWEPHESGYGHMHVAVFVEAGDLEASRFEKVMNSYVENTKPAGREAHTVENAVSVNDDVNNLGSYVSEYIGIFGDETLNRPMKEQAFYAVTWATNTRRVEFSNGAQEIQQKEQFRRETGLIPEERGSGGPFERWREDDESADESAESMAGVEIDPEEETVSRADESTGWELRSLCRVDDGEPEYHETDGGGVEMIEIVGSEEADPPKELGDSRPDGET